MNIFKESRQGGDNSSSGQFQENEAREREVLRQRVIPTFEASKILNKSEEYRNRVCASKDFAGDPLNWLHAYVSEALEIGTARLREGVKVSTVEIEKLVENCEEIYKEAKENENLREPNLLRIDSILTDFLYNRLKHWKNTLEQRKATTAKSLFEHYQSEGGNTEEKANSEENWKKSVSSEMSNANQSIAGIGVFSKKVDNYNAAILVDLGNKLSLKAGVLLDANPFLPDNYKE